MQLFYLLKPSSQPQHHVLDCGIAFHCQCKIMLHLFYGSSTQLAQQIASGTLRNFRDSSINRLIIHSHMLTIATLDSDQRHVISVL